MTHQPTTDSSPGSSLFPEYATLYDLVAAEVSGLTDEELGFESDRWEWSKWSIRIQLSHMASLIYRWLLLRWGDTLFPEEDHGVRDVKGLAASDFDRRLDESRYWELPVILAQLKGGIDLAQRVLDERSVGFLRSHTYLQQPSPQWGLMAQAHPTGIAQGRRPGEDDHHPGSDHETHLLRGDNPPVQHPAAQAGAGTGNRGGSAQGRLLGSGRLGPQRAGVAHPLGFPRTCGKGPPLGRVPLAGERKWPPAAPVTLVHVWSP